MKKKDKKKGSIVMEQEKTPKPQNDSAPGKYTTATDVKDMILEGKLDIAKWQINWMLFLFGLLGIAFPIGLALFQTSRIDKQIESMETRFEKLAGTRFKEPRIVCKTYDTSLENDIVEFNGRDPAYIFISNEGEGTSGKIRAYLYFSSPVVEAFISTDSSWERIESENKKDYPKKYFVGGTDSLMPQEVFNVEMELGNRGFTDEAGPRQAVTEARALLKVVFEDALPIEVPFTVKFIEN